VSKRWLNPLLKPAASGQARGAPRAVVGADRVGAQAVVLPVDGVAGEDVDPCRRVAAEQDRHHLAALGVAHVVAHLRRGRAAERHQRDDGREREPSHRRLTR
jgi:hypothetical protein